MRYDHITLSILKKRFKGQYVEVMKQYDYSTQEWRYTVVGAYRTIRENTTLAEDLETAHEYRR